MPLPLRLAHVKTARHQLIQGYRQDQQGQLEQRAVVALPAVGMVRPEQLHWDQLDQQGLPVAVELAVEAEQALLELLPVVAALPVVLVAC